MTDKAFYRIKDVKDRWYKSFLEVYAISFPVHEQRNASQQITAFDNKHYHLIIKTAGEKLVSFIAYWDFKDYVYIEHLAVNPELRGQNKGSELLEDFAEMISKAIILEIDPPINKIAKKRLEFYKKLGYEVNSYVHFHPAYNEIFTPHELIILSLNRKLTKGEYHEFYDDLCNIVMKTLNS